jgi:3-hydroxyisobutyrate dehydrogenase-like beta-hydroxyacid dehydrogenase
MEIGFLGLGAMGAPMAANLVRAGHRLRVWNRSRAPVSALIAIGAAPADSPGDAAADADILISMLADDVATQAVVVDGGALDALAPRAIHINMATISVALAVRLERSHREKGVAYIAAPVLGRSNVAEAGTRSAPRRR